MTYEEYKDKISALKAEYAVASNANQKLYDDINNIIKNITDSNVNSASVHDVNLNFFKTLDLDKIAKDTKYKKEVLEIIDNELTKLCSLLDGVLK